MTLKEKVGQFFFPAAFINDSEENYVAIEKLIVENNIGGLTFFHSRASAATNYEDKQAVHYYEDSLLQLKKLIERYQKCASTPLLFCIDAEWGMAMRIENTPQYPYAITIGALATEDGKEMAYQVGKQIGLDLKSVGLHYNLAPLADINNNPKNPVIGYRSFGQEKEKVGDFALSYLRGLNDAGVLGCLKHFPGHGNTSVDSHLDLPILEDSLEDLFTNELQPFIKGIAANADSIMIGHLAVPALNDGKITSATLSKNIIDKLLRKQLGYTGLIISDALNMHSVSKLYTTKGELEWHAFDAGNDVLCFAENVTEGIEAIVKNATKERIEASYQRIYLCKQKAGVFLNKKTEKLEFDWKRSAEINRSIAEKSLTTLVNKNFHPVVLKAAKEKKLAKVSFYQTTDTPFFANLQNEIPSPEFFVNASSNLKEVFLQLIDFELLILALFVPKAKPAGNFGLDASILKFLETLVNTKKCVLYVFGNPYALGVLPKCENLFGCMQVYQDFTVFQENAAKQLIKNSKTTGRLPVTVTGF